MAEDRMAHADQDQRLRDLTAMFCFLLAAEREGQMLGGYRASDVVSAAGRLIGWDDAAVDRLRGRLK